MFTCLAQKIFSPFTPLGSLLTLKTVGPNSKGKSSKLSIWKDALAFSSHPNLSAYLKIVCDYTGYSLYTTLV